MPRERSSLRRSLSSLFLFSIAARASGQIAFEDAVSYPVGQQAEEGVLIDFTGDGRPDLVITSGEPDKLEFLANRGDGTLDDPVLMPTGNGTGPEGVASGDFDGDGDVDLVIVMSGRDEVRLALNDGSGHFAFGASFAVGSDPRIVAAADFDGDGRVDAAVANRVSGDVSVLINDGAGGFDGATNYPVGLEPRCVAAGDVTGDGLPDLAVSARDSRIVRLFRSVGDGTFETLRDLSLGSILEPQGVAFADFDRDEKLDVVTATSGNVRQEHASVFLQENGGHPWVGPVNGDTRGVSPTGIATADFDLDGFVDVVTANADSSDVSALKNGGIGIFMLPVVFPVGLDPQALVLLTGDLDGNGGEDVVTVNRDGASVSVLINRAGRQEVCQPDLGFGGPGSAVLTVCGDALETGGAADLLLEGAAPTSRAWLAVSSTSGPRPFKGGTLVPNPIRRAIPFTTDAAGEVIRPDIPGGGGPKNFFVQFVIEDAAQPRGFALSNALRVEFLP